MISVLDIKRNLIIFFYFFPLFSFISVYSLKKKNNMAVSENKYNQSKNGLVIPPYY